MKSIGAVFESAVPHKLPASYTLETDLLTQVFGIYGQVVLGSEDAGGVESGKSPRESGGPFLMCDVTEIFRTLLSDSDHFPLIFSDSHHFSRT